MALFGTIVRKDFTSQSVHVGTALGNGGRKSRFRAKLGPGTKVIKRELKPHDADTAKSPFLYDVNALSDLRPDQVPRFFGALTDSDNLPVETVDLDTLHAMQDRVDPKKVEAIAAAGAAGGKLPVVVRNNGKHYIADGHHRLAAQWLAGEKTAQVRFKDLEPVSNAMKRDPGGLHCRVAKVDQNLGLVFGWAIVCKVNGEDYYDLNVDQAGPHEGERVPEHIPEATMVKAALGFVDAGAKGNEMHEGPDVGTYPFVFPLTTDIAKAMGISSNQTGLMVAYKPPKDVLQKFADGTYSGFSIEGKRIRAEEHE